MITVTILTGTTKERTQRFVTLEKIINSLKYIEYLKDGLTPQYIVDLDFNGNKKQIWGFSLRSIFEQIISEYSVKNFDLNASRDLLNIEYNQKCSDIFSSFVEIMITKIVPK